jgi:hypothetical protein
VRSGSRREIYDRADDLADVVDKRDGEIETSSRPGDSRYVCRSRSVVHSSEGPHD